MNDTIIKKRLHNAILSYISENFSTLSRGLRVKDREFVLRRALFYAILEKKPNIRAMLHDPVWRWFPKDVPRYFRRVYGLDVPIQLTEDSGYWDWIDAVVLASPSSPEHREAVANLMLYLSYFEDDDELLRDSESISRGLDALYVLWKTGNIEERDFVKYRDLFLNSEGISSLDKFRITLDGKVIHNNYSLLKEPQVWWLLK